MSQKLNSIERIFRRASMGSVAAIVLVLMAALAFASYQDLRFLRDSESRVLAFSAPRVLRALSAELMLGDDRSVQAIRGELQKELGLASLEISPTQLACSDSLRESCWAGEIPSVQPVRYVRFYASIPVGGMLRGAKVLIWAFLPILLIGFLVLYRIRVELNRAVVAPILTLVRDPENWRPNGSWVAKEVVDLRSLLVRYNQDRESHLEERERLRFQASLGEIAIQVAHDIRSPLAALEVAGSATSELPEGSRILVQSAIDRIREIADHLLARNRSGKTDLDFSMQKTKEFLSPLIEGMAAEKRVKWSNQSVAIESRLVNGYGIFSEVESSDFKRMISNLIDNALEACASDGRVSVYLDSVDSFARVRIRDNGKGIPADVLPLLGERGASHGKPGGSGLGLHHAKTKSESWGGRLEIESVVNGGTCVSILLPKVAPPNWFVPKLEVPIKSRLLILDDDDSVHGVWRHRFEEMVSQKQINPLIHLRSPAEFAAWMSQEGSSEFLLLADYELRGFSESGLDLIERFNLQKKAILVTSNWDEESVRIRCLDQGLRLLPKSMASLVPISLGENSASDWDAVLIDDDELVRSMWEFEARRKGKTVRVFSDVNSFLAESAFISLDTPIYVDSCLQSEKNGEDYSEELFGRGFRNLYLATGRPASHFGRGMPWLRGIVGKAPPFAIASNFE